MVSFILLVKVLFLCVFAIAIRGTLPRYRFDQFTQLNWKHFVFIWLAYLIISVFFNLMFF